MVFILPEINHLAARPQGASKNWCSPLSNAITMRVERIFWGFLECANIGQNRIWSG
jgi:hypothetical protein